MGRTTYYAVRLERGEVFGSATKVVALNEKEAAIKSGLEGKVFVFPEAMGQEFVVETRKVAQRI